MFLRFKILVVVFCWCAALLFWSYGDPNDAWKTDIDALKVAMNCPQMAIQFWNAESVVNTASKPNGTH
jgi:hypothetical protein